MVKFISFHSLKGGTGKTTLASNLAVLSALSGQKVCLLDFDFRAPSLHAFFRSNPSHWLNDFLNGHCDFSETLCRVDTNNVGKLVVGFADPSTEAMRDMMTKDREWEAEALRKVLSAKTIMLTEEYDLMVFDTSPGIQYSSINALAASNLIILVMNRDELNRRDVANLIDKIYKPLGRKIGVALNKVIFCSSADKTENLGKTSRDLNNLSKSVERMLKCPVYGIISCFCEVLMDSNEVYAYHKSSHPFVAEISALIENIQES